MFRALFSSAMAVGLVLAAVIPSAAWPQESERFDEATQASATCAVALIREARMRGDDAWSLRGLWPYRFFLAEGIVREGRFDDGRGAIMKRAVAEAAKTKTTLEVLNNCRSRLPAVGQHRGWLSGDPRTDLGVCMFMAGYLEGAAETFSGSGEVQHYEKFGLKLIDKLKSTHRRLSQAEQRVIDQHVAAMLRAAPDMEVMQECQAKFEVQGG